MLIILSFISREQKMRFKVGIEFDESLELPFNYNKILQGFIYRNIMDKDLARFIHDRGFSYEKRKYKMFTFQGYKVNFQLTQKRKKLYINLLSNWLFHPAMKISLLTCLYPFYEEMSKLRVIKLM